MSIPERGRAESVICVGDSAGGNLAAVVALRALEEGVQAPSGVMMIYPALYLHMTPCASRVLSLMDPLLPLGTLQVPHFTCFTSTNVQMLTQQVTRSWPSARGSCACARMLSGSRYSVCVLDSYNSTNTDAEAPGGAWGRDSGAAQALYSH